MTDNDRPLLTPRDAKAQPGEQAWALLVFESAQIALAAIYFATGLWFRAPNQYIYVMYFAGFLLSIITLIWAVVTLRTSKRKGIPRLVIALSAISVGLYLVSALVLAWITASLHP